MADVGLYTLEDARRILGVANRFDSRLPPGKPLDNRRKKFRGWKPPRKFQAPSGGIPARSGTTPGSAECDIVELIDGALTQTGESVSVYSWASQPVCDTGDRFGLAELHNDLEWWVEAEDCEDMPSTTPSTPFTVESNANESNIGINSHSIAIPTSDPQPGDYLIAIFGSEPNRSHSPPSGWNFLASETIGTSTFGMRSSVIYREDTTGTLSGNVTMTAGGSAFNWSAQILRLRNLGGSYLMDFADSQSLADQSPPITTRTGTTTITDEVLFVVANSRWNGQTTGLDGTVSAGFTPIVHNNRLLTALNEMATPGSAVAEFGILDPAVDAVTHIFTLGP